MDHKKDPAIERLLEKGIAAARRQSEPNGGVPARYVNRQRQQARALLATVLQVDRGNLQAWMWLSTVVDSPAEQKICLKQILALDPNNDQALTALARLHGDRSATEEKQQRARPGSGSGSKLRRLSSQRLPADPGNVSAGCPFCLRPVFATGTSCPQCGLLLAMNCPACGQAVDVEHADCDQCGQTMGNYRDREKYFARLGKKYLKTHRFQDAVKAWRMVAMLDRDFPRLYLRLGQAHLGSGRPDRAEKSLLRALQQDPNDQNTNFTMAELLRRRGETEQAFDYYQAVIRINPKRGMAWLRLAGIYEQVGANKEAKIAYRKAVRWLQPGSTASLQARFKLEGAKPALPEAMATSWFEFLRQVSGPILVCVMFALFDSGLRPWWIPATGWLALLLGHCGAVLFVSGSSLPRNPLVQLIAGEQGMRAREHRLLVAIVGACFWLAAMGLILWPINQSFPEPPDLW